MARAACRLRVDMGPNEPMGRPCQQPSARNRRNRPRGVAPGPLATRQSAPHGATRPAASGKRPRRPQGSRTGRRAQSTVDSAVEYHRPAQASEEDPVPQLLGDLDPARHHQRQPSVRGQGLRELRSLFRTRAGSRQGNLPAAAATGTGISRTGDTPGRIGIAIGRARPSRRGARAAPRLGQDSHDSQASQAARSSTKPDPHWDDGTSWPCPLSAHPEHTCLPAGIRR